MDSDNMYQKAHDLCYEIWPNFLFTPLIMVQWLLAKSSLTWEDLIRDRSFDKGLETLKTAIDEAKEEDLRPLWANLTGVCTSWAVRIALDLQENDDISFSFGDKGGHRAAWAPNGLGIDSSAKIPLDLGDGRIKRIKGTEWVMKNPRTPDALLCSGPPGKMADFLRLEDHMEAMKICLAQIMTPKKRKDLTFFSLYRSVQGNQLRFNGSLIWKVTSQESVISVGEVFETPDGANRKETIHAIFRHDNELADGERDLQKSLCSRFYRFHKEKGRGDQFAFVEKVYKEIWGANIKFYGPPMYKLQIE